MSTLSQLQASWLRRGALAYLLRPISWAYGFLRWLTAIRFRLGFASSQRLPVPVIVVGNLIAGGAGKTPTTMALVHALRARGFTPGIVSRGYRRQSNDVVLVDRETHVQHAGDEPLLMHLRTGAPVAVGADRAEAGLALLAANPSIDMLVSDDGLQHHRLQRDAQLIVFDERGAGNGWLLPAGPLREPMPASPPPRSVVLYNAAAPSTRWRGHLAARRLAGVARLSDWWLGVPATSQAMAALRGRNLIAAAGLAQPQRFFDMLRANGMSIIELALPDHDDFTTLQWPVGTTDVIVTEKDAVKLQPSAMGTTQVWVATLDFALPPALVDELLRYLPTYPTRS